MADLKSLNEMLAAAFGILDLASEEIRDIPLEPTIENVSKIGQALSLIFDIQSQLYKINPSLVPEYLKRPSSLPPEVSREFGDVIINANDLCDMGRYKEAISLFENFIAKNPPHFFIKMAKSQIMKIKKDNVV